MLARMRPVLLALVLAACGKPTEGHWPANPQFRAGFAKVAITPQGVEGFTDWDNDGHFEPDAHMVNGQLSPAEVFIDSGIDGKLDFEETGAFGPDGKPGKA